MAYASIRTDRAAGTKLATRLASVKFMDGGNESAIENGSVVLVGELLAGEREVKKATAPEKDSKLYRCGLVAGPEVVKNQTRNTLGEFINKAGLPVRVYLFTQGDCYSVTKEALTIAEGYTVKVGDTLELNGTTKLGAVATATEGATVVGKITEIAGDWYAFEIE